MNQNKDAPIAITMGDAAGIGPEITLKAIESLSTTDPKSDSILVYGNKPLLQRTAKELSIKINPNWFDSHVIDVGQLDSDCVTPGRFSAQTGQASADAVCKAIDDAMDRQISAIVTAPIQKEAWKLAGILHPGHTELLAERTGTKNVSMMLASPRIACVLATIHIGLADVANTLSIPLVRQAIEHAIPVARARSRVRTQVQAQAQLQAQAAKRNANANGPCRITVCGLNPHAGENGMFGEQEEEKIILPAMDSFRQSDSTHPSVLGNVELVGPIPADTAFTPQQLDQTDVYIAMYHDQGLIPVKTLSFDSAVNVTLGLPIIRTSVDHGTAMDLAGKGVADHRNLLAAIAEARAFVRR